MVKNRSKTLRTIFPIIFILIGFSTCNGPKTDEEISNLKVITNPVILGNDTSVVCNGEVLFSGTSEIINRGFCWSTKPNPSLFNYKISAGKGIGKFTRTINVLDPRTKYYFRAFAINATDTAYGETITFTTDPKPTYIFNPKLIYGTVADQEGNSYKTIKIGNQTWMAQNLRTRIFQNGDSIYGAQYFDVCKTCDYPLQVAYLSLEQKDSLYKYGRHYNWMAISDKRKISPKGWHVATDSDWNELEETLMLLKLNYLENDYKLARSLASSKCWNPSLIYWSIGSNPHKNNGSGFSAIPAGLYNQIKNPLYSTAYWWSYGSVGEYNCRILFYNNSKLLKTYISKQYGLSVRCVKD